MNKHYLLLIKINILGFFLKLLYLIPGGTVTNREQREMIEQLEIVTPFPHSWTQNPNFQQAATEAWQLVSNEQEEMNWLPNFMTHTRQGGEL
jgi:hypothetical protein